ncbi:phosphatase PAP2 family protein [Simiduia litorea]|uniref:acid phosphatase n=1 Tax=Simiduia litorea TaxID=1435348 RepID=UPI0036F1FD27
MKKMIGLLRALLLNVLVVSSVIAENTVPTLSATPVVPPTEVAERYPGLLIGYLEAGAIPDDLSLVPAVPAAGSVEALEDARLNRQQLTLQNTKRWQWAAQDASLVFPSAGRLFSCAADKLLEPEAMPHLNMLLRRSLTDFGLSTSWLKKHYQRPRPFLSNQQAICIPDELEGLRTSGSYPSGHAAIGWGWALIFAQMLPHRAKEIMARGQAFGDSRAICNVHWASDVAAGQTMADFVFDRLRANPVFNAEFALAKAEVLAARKELSGQRCRVESDVLNLNY